jgi:predicted dehydrogenase
MQYPGPLYDIGPYYLTALVHLFRPVASVAAVGGTARPTRTIQVGDRAGTVFPVEVPTHVNAIAQFTGGGVAQSVFSFESPLARAGVVETTGTEATMVVPDPNNVDGDVRITRAATVENLMQDPEWVTIPATGVVAGRGTGVLDLARSHEARTATPQLRRHGQPGPGRAAGHPSSPEGDVAGRPAGPGGSVRRCACEARAGNGRGGHDRKQARDAGGVAAAS